MKCLAQEHNTMTWPGLQPGPLDPGSNVLTIRPPFLGGRGYNLSIEVGSKGGGEWLLMYQ